MVAGMLTIYALGHFAVDFLCAWAVLGRLAGFARWPELALVYNFCAFALQMPVGIVADRVGRNRSFSGWGALLALLGAAIRVPWATVILCGLGNALYHVGGGRETLLESRGYGTLGIFVAPGALGIFLGSLLRGSTWPGILGAGLLLICGFLLFGSSRREIPSPREMGRPCRKAVLRVVLLFLVVLLRSFGGMTMVTPWKTGAWVLAGTLLGAAGKALGGFAADGLGGRVGAGLSLLAAAVLFLFPASPVCGVLGGLLFHMSMPVTLGDSAQALPGGEGFAFGLLTFALFLGFLPAMWGISLTPWQGALVALLSGLMLLLAAEGRKPCTT